MPHVKFFFNHKLTGADFNKNLAWFEKKKDAGQESRAAEIEISFDFMIGADGAHSAVRYHLMKFARVNYQQEYIDTLWCEFQIPPDENTGAFRLSPNHLHIWPGGDFMFIAIPSMDHSFTSTLFLPAAHFTALSTNPASLVAFFQEYFPGVVPDLISPISLQRQFAANPHLPLISIKCTPHHYRAAAVIVGDAAHAMVPFYGQGMNAGLEDVRVLFECLDRAAPSSSADDGAAVQAREAALAAYTTQRTPDAHAINDLALHNYAEMRAGVRSPLYRARKWVEERVDVWLPALGWHTRYARVSFGNQRYSDVERDVEVQSLMLVGAMSVLGGGVVAALAGLLLRLRR
ncbi:MAG: kynurenine 3-monooxygenase, mitochondrial precursor [Thelocarpon impressellum]|nr:MAG: kynurenine 3-monooxygenase, mitochondrial precursor [Thelocarpon impressellum]